MNRRSLLKLAGIGALVPVVTKADALRIDKGEQPKDAVEQMPTATGMIGSLSMKTEAWNQYNRLTLEIILDNTAETYEMLKRYRDGPFEVAIVPIVKG